MNIFKSLLLTEVQYLVMCLIRNFHLLDWISTPN